MTAKPETLDDRALNRALLARQMLLARDETPAALAIERLNGLQAQEARPPFIALWSRLRDFRREDLLTALHERKVVKATFTRGTLHLVSAGDYLAFRATHATVLEAAMRTEMKDAVFASNLDDLVAAARAALASGPLTFADLRAVLAKRWPDLNERHMGYAVRLNLPLIAAPDDSAWGGKAGAAFAQADQWLDATPDTPGRLPEVVQHYLAAFGPATVADIQAFTGFKGLKPVVDALRPELAVFHNSAGKALFDMPEAPRPDADTPAPVRFLPDFDGVMLGHADRSRVISEEHRKALGNKNLRVPAVFLVDGVAAGRWSLTATKTKATLEAQPFGTLAKGVKDELVAEGEALLRFVAPEAKTVTVAFAGP